MANGNFEAHVDAVVAAGTATEPGRSYCGGVEAAHFVFARLAHAERWTSGYASAVWNAALPAISKREDDDIPF